eukprot:Phypoly_transcript_03150.p1 GENE.Phypoly_transcript_03150~~Phypoly_transcript_03150.p1  ORF type:complete len:455 (+),score=115.12 Phypoly_transcript_03150:1180-2544(+)
MGLELVPAGGINTNELVEKLNAPKPTSSPPSPALPPSPSLPRANSITNDCAIAISKDGSLCAIGKYNLLLLVKMGGNWKISKLLEDESQAQPGEYITQLTILPLNKPQNPHCVIAGYSSGFIRLFGVTGVQYVAQKFHHGPVRRLVVCTGGTVDVGVMALYDGGVIASLTNFHLPDPSTPSDAPPSPSIPPTTAATSSSQSPTPQPGSTTISYRKWHLFGMENVNDLLFVSPYAGAPAAGRVVATGRNPMISFYTVTEEQNSSLRVAVALASTVASKLTSAVVSLAKNWWWGGDKSTETEQKDEKEKAREREQNAAANEIPVSLSVRWGMHDPNRQVNAIVEAPANRCLAVIVDGFGRVSLVDTRACVLVRMWKGYRDAQCGWVVTRARGEGEKEGLFLVIHAPRRGIVEVWRMRHGARVCAQGVGAGWRLVSAGETCYFVDKNGLVHNVVLKE